MRCTHPIPSYPIQSHLIQSDRSAGKLIVWGDDRAAAITRMKRALKEMVITGVPTTSQYHYLILSTKAFQEGDVDTGFIIKYADEL